MIEFNATGSPTYSDVGMFPTYSVYVNGSLVAPPARRDFTHQSLGASVPSDHLKTETMNSVIGCGEY